MSSLNLKQREEQAAGNADDSLNPGNKHYNEELLNQKKGASDGEINNDFDEILAANGMDSPGEKEMHGDKVRRNYNADDPDDSRSSLNDSEDKGDSLYKNSSSDQTQSGFSSWFARHAKKFGASGGVLGILGIGMVVISVILSPAALFAAIEKGLTNDGSDFSRTNSSAWKAYRGSIFKSECTGSKLKCKMTTGTKKMVTDFVENRFKVKGIVVDADGKEAEGGERDLKPDDIKEGQNVKVKEVTYPNGVVTKSGAEMEAEENRNVDSKRSALNAMNHKTRSFFSEKFDKVMKKLNLSKGTIATRDSRPPESEEDRRRTVQNARNTADGKVLTGLNKFSKGAGLTTGVITTGCTVYNTLRIVVGIVKAKWILDVITFAFPFVQIASKLADGNATDKDFDQVIGRADQLTWYQNSTYTEKLASQASTPEEATKIRGKKDLSATDAQSLRMAMYGDTTELLDFTKDYTSGGIGSIKGIGEGIDEFQEAFPGGTTGIRATCINAQRGAFAEAGVQILACVLGSALSLGLAAGVCVAKGVIASVALNEAQDRITNYIIERLIESLKNADVPSDLRGVDAGNALAAGMGMMLAQTGYAYGMKPAKSVDEVREFIAMTNDDYYKDYIEVAMDDAKKNPFDLYNQYSFASIMSSALNPYISSEKTGFGFGINAMTVVANALTPGVNAVYSQPSLMTNTEENLKHRLSVNDAGEAVCPDADKAEQKIICDKTGRTVGITSKRVLTWLNQMANGDTTPLLETIDYMSQEGAYKDVGKTNEFSDGFTDTVPEMGRTDQPYTPNNEGGTRDQTCDDLDNMFDRDCDSSQQMSINEDGTPKEGSQYKLYKTYCTDERELDAGSSGETLEAGSSKFQDWVTMKQCAKDSMMMDRFQMYMIMCEGAYSIANGNICTGTQTAAVTAGSGDACSLMNNPNIVYVNEGTKKGLKEICETGKSVNSCGDTNYTLDAELMNVITTLSSKYKVWLNNFGFQYDRNSCDTGQHPKGKAIDLNGIEKIGGDKAGGPDWGGITYGDPKQVAVIEEYASDWLAAIARNHGGVGQQGCGGGRNGAFQPSFPAGSINVNGAAFFYDSCDHLHIDVRDRGGGASLDV